MTRILLVDDDKDVRDVLHSILVNSGYEVLAVADGGEALIQFAQGEFDIVITDIIMPVKDGLETISEILELKPGTRIIAMSGGGRQGNVDFLETAKALGASLTFNKPFNLRDLIEGIEQLTTEQA
jgi:CheY-like chemotaxis protein